MEGPPSLWAEGRRSLERDYHIALMQNYRQSVNPFISTALPCSIRPATSIMKYWYLILTDRLWRFYHIPQLSLVVPPTLLSTYPLTIQ